MQDRNDQSPSLPGTYALLLRADDEQTIEVGALGRMTVQVGLYVYVGSAFGPGGLQARVRRHVRAEGALHWHIDYLRAVTSPAAVWYTADPERRECRWATAVQALDGARAPLAGFGASDCGCPAHLAAFVTAPSFEAFRHHLRAECPDHAPVARRKPQAWIE